jgi:hypothetical protein
MEVASGVELAPRNQPDTAVTSGRFRRFQVGPPYEQLSKGRGEAVVVISRVRRRRSQLVGRLFVGRGRDDVSGVPPTVTKIGAGVASMAT